MSIINKIDSILEKNADLYIDRDSLWNEGDKVRILKSLNINVGNVSEYLGQICIVDKVHKHININNNINILYALKLGNKIESFYEYELDARYKRKKER